MQRFFDIVFSGLAILILSPLLIIIMFILKLTGEGEVFYKQERVGREGKTFNLLKFATMLKNSPNIGNKTITIHNDPRVLPFGRILRKTKINEIPQLFNILVGDMSVIGPRPMIKSTFVQYESEVQEAIKKVRPGLSGIGSIVFRDEETLLTNTKIDREKFYKQEILPYKGKLEKWYVENKSIYLYFVLIFLTIIVVINPKSSLYKKILNNLPQEPSIFNIILGENK